MTVWVAEILRAWRASLRRPGFLLLASGVLALGVGVTTAVFSMADGVLLKPLPYPDAQRLVAMGSMDEGHVQSLSPQEFQHIQAIAGVAPMALYERFAPAVNLSGGGAPAQVHAIFANRQLLPTLGVKPLLGRNFDAGEDTRGGPGAVMLGHALWTSRFGGDVHVLGRVVQIEGRPRTVVGVLPPGFDLVDGDLMLPTALPAVSRNDASSYQAIARLLPGATALSVSAEVNTRLHTFYMSRPADDPYAARLQQSRFGAETLHDALGADSRPVLGLFLACAGLVLLIALINLTNLMLLRTLSRAHEVAIRVTLGASRWRLGWPALAEGTLIGLLGSAAGLGLSVLGLHALARFMPDDWVAHGAVQLTPSAWLLAPGLGLFGALLATVLGLWQGRRSEASMDALREGGRTGLGLRSGRLGRALVVAQVALAATLLGAAGLLLHTLYDAAHAPLGLDGDGVVTFELAPVQAAYPDIARVRALTQRLRDGLRAQPGIADAAVMTNLPIGRGDRFGIGGFDIASTRGANVQLRGVGDNFFRVFRIHRREGRDFAPTDTTGSEPVAIVSRSLAEHYFGGHAVGKTITRETGVDGGTWSVRIVGVVDDTRQSGALQPPTDTLYLPFAQLPDHEWRILRGFFPLRFALAVRGGPGTYANAIHEAVRAVAPDQPVANIRPLHQVIAQTYASTVTVLSLVGLFAVLALLLAAAGMYAVMAVAVAAREREFGVRTALGAAPARVLREVLRGGLFQIGIGLAAGVLLSVGLSGVLRAVVQQQDLPRIVDPLAIAAVCLCLILSGLLACLVPALRAARVHPMRALRAGP